MLDSRRSLHSGCAKRRPGCGNERVKIQRVAKRKTSSGDKGKSAQAPAPVLFGRRRVRPYAPSVRISDKPDMREGMVHREAQGIPDTPRSIADKFTRARKQSAEARPPHGAPSAAFIQRRAALYPGCLAAAQIRARHIRVSQLLAGGPSASGRSPGAARVRACEARPQAPHPTPPSRRLMKTPSVDGIDRNLVQIDG